MANTFSGGIKLPHRNSADDIPSDPVSPSKICLTAPTGYTVTAETGNKVSVGDILASSPDDREDLLCGISGEVVSCELAENGTRITVRSDFLDKRAESCQPIQKNINDISPDELASHLKRFGIPVPRIGKKTPECLLINCCETSPASSAVTRLIREQAPEIIGGIKIFMKLLGIRKAICAMPKAMYACANELEAYLPNSRMIKVKLVSDKYPQHEPHLLVSSLFNLEINSGVAVADAGYPTVSAPVCAAAFRALAEGIPYTETIVTLTGDALPLSCNLRVPFGTEIGELIELSYGRADSPEKILLGGETGGYPISDRECITHRTSALTFLRKAPCVKPHSCIRCGRCAEVCPMRLVPSLLCEYAREDNRPMCEQFDLLCCIECGCCTAVCPAGIDIRNTLILQKSKIRGENAEGASDEF